ncbi:MAG TPA: hypothetical protein VFM71_11465 [Gemmatimonadaceae bacterium]|nr:hypothetical protein [Gemmatimonadaceae bacterium]
MQTIDGVLEAVSKAGDALANAVRHEMALEDGRCVVKVRAIQRIMQGENPLTGKMHSASSAEAVVETDAEYAQYRDEQRTATVMKIRAQVAYECAKTRARMAVSASEVLS